MSVVSYINAQPVALAASVMRKTPLTLTTNDQNATLLETGRRALLILQKGGQFAKAEAQILTCEKYAEGWRIETGNLGWQEVDRRRHPRFAVQMPVTVKAVLDVEGNARLKYVEASLKDLSLGGAEIRSPELIPEGRLVELQLETKPGELTRILSVVVWAKDGLRHGLEFVDFLGKSRDYLQDFLSERS